MKLPDVTVFLKIILLFNQNLQKLVVSDIQNPATLKLVEIYHGSKLIQGTQLLISSPIDLRLRKAQGTIFGQKRPTEASEEVFQLPGGTPRIANTFVGKEKGGPPEGGGETYQWPRQQ